MSSALPRLHAVTDERIARRLDLDVVVCALARGAPGLAMHARGRTLTGREHYDLAVRLGPSPSASSRLFLNDRLDIALAVGAAGVQLRHDSLPVADARRLGPGWLIGRSVHSLAEARAAQADGADYLVVGPVFATATHGGSEPLGLARLHEVVAVGLPVVAIGGMTAERIREVRGAGAWGVAAIRALWDAPDAEAAARAMQEELR